MAWPTIDETKPLGSDKVKTIDDAERETRTFTKVSLGVISNYTDSGTQPALRSTVWTTATRPTGANLVDRVTGYNTTLGYEEYYDLVSATWKSKSQTAIDAVVPIGSIMMWSGSVATIPAKWHLCDGTNGTINLQDKFIVGAGSTYAVAATGGEATHVLTTNEMPSHNHGGVTSVDSPDHTHNISTRSNSGTDIVGQGNNSGTLTSYATGGASVRHTHAITAQGGGAAHENRPPYYALAFIQRIS